MTGARQQFTQLLRASIAQGRRVQQAGLGGRQLRQQARVGRCVCGALVITHWDDANRFVGCSHAQKVGS